MRLCQTFFLIGITVFCFAGSVFANEPVRYLAFQLFISGSDSSTMQQAFPPSSPDLSRTVKDLRDRIGISGVKNRQLGFILGPIAFDHSDEDVHKLIAAGFDIALETGVAVGFHLDDSMFWGRLKTLNTVESIEWLDWQGTPNTGRRLDWSSKPLKIMPQLCLNSRAVKAAVAKRALLIGQELAVGVKKLKAAHRDTLFLGLIAGWETQIGRDFDTGKYLGYCALTNAGYSAKNPPADIDLARSKITMEFIGSWVRLLIAAGVPDHQVYSHIAYLSSTMYKLVQQANPADFSAPYLRTINFTSPSVAFCDHCLPGISTYPQPGHLEQWQEALNKHGDPFWASSEGSAIDPGSGKGMDMEGYLGNLFNHGAVLVNVFGWGVGEETNPFRTSAESKNSLAAYRKFLAGETLPEAPIPVPVMPPSGLIEKIHQIQAELPSWIQKNGSAQVKDNLEQLDKAIKQNNFEAATQAAHTILQIIGTEKK